MGTLGLHALRRERVEGTRAVIVKVTTEWIVEMGGASEEAVEGLCADLDGVLKWALERGGFPEPIFAVRVAGWEKATEEEINERGWSE